MTTKELVTTQNFEAQRQKRQAMWRKNIFRFLDYGLMLFMAFIFIFPILFMIVAAFKPDDRVTADLRSLDTALLPSDPTLENFGGLNLFGDEELGKHGCEIGATMGTTPIRGPTDCGGVFDRLPFPTFFFNSVMLTVTGVVVGLFLNSMLAYVLARLRWAGRTLVLSVVVSMIIVPTEAFVVPLLIQVNEMSTFLNILLSGVLIGLTLLFWAILWNAANDIINRRYKTSDIARPVQMAISGAFVLLCSAPLTYLTFLVVQQTFDGNSWLDTFHVQILPFLAEPFSIFLFYQFFISIPRDFDEAAVIDGASRVQIYWQIILPLSKPVFATVAILKMMAFWSFFLWPLLVTRDEATRPLMVGISYFYTEPPIRWGSIMAYSAMVIIPVLVVFLIFQRWFVASLASSGVKG